MEYLSSHPRVDHLGGQHHIAIPCHSGASITGYRCQCLGGGLWGWALGGLSALHLTRLAQGLEYCMVAVLGGEVLLTPVSYTHLRAHETPEHLVCRLLLEKKKTFTQIS
eukprot:TRINITY_DN12528_c0_g2_i1.p1 TRINITY_DN12528_c0_g2~~TRINITY_DN12528_c0_g2_i1.p1  ORF type:complete len:109 (-),score=15.30 TRINITY_DN12528_c0_g2_i1:4-330(-)